MNYNELKEKAHSNAVNHGFWKKRLSNEHFLMLVITEISELVEADRNELKADKAGFDTGMANAFQGIIRPDWFNKVFRACIKNTLEDEMADIAIRLFDLAGALGVDFEKMQPCRYCRDFDRFSFTENAFALVKGLSKDQIAIEKRIQFGLNYIESWARQQGINLKWHITKKMKYNQFREAMHGKKY
ncbi:hypothetical protein ACTMKN_11000 [Bacteroides pyogenes]|uniref:Uncharacterized protein n=1 Tax=Bacteroides pyogenes TaxID=310300 RepID=A0A5D3EW05_9BACE|nr:hypothetical protein [Bacteroides pyogenes]MBR8725509.1 hypothetical protein [Bacteroides pyogenes]MBR8737710.1 hypothetical protein [Bacteroides pyogenes]MBR8753244.1 hypothetical protein [Bacteroides pyogenes]MBR8794666.1 hypothetical protein [Bacteroides pyogenes]MCF2708146.1 hypothetical protein [Bacteroides pyogenes]